MHLLVAGIALSVPTLVYSCVLKYYQFGCVDHVEFFENTALSVECVIFNILFVYRTILKHKYKDLCKDTGTLVGTIAVTPVYLLGVVSTFIGSMVILCYGVHLIKSIDIKRLCRRRPKVKKVESTSLANLPYFYFSDLFHCTTTECSICLGDFGEEDKVSPLNCDINHLFHTECIKKWLDKNMVCPLCKFSIHPTELKLFNRNVKRLVLL